MDTFDLQYKNLIHLINVICYANTLPQKFVFYLISHEKTNVAGLATGIKFLWVQQLSVPPETATLAKNFALQPPPPKQGSVLNKFTFIFPEALPIFLKFIYYLEGGANFLPKIFQHLFRRKIQRAVSYFNPFVK